MDNYRDMMEMERWRRETDESTPGLALQTLKRRQVDVEDESTCALSKKQKADTLPQTLDTPTAPLPADQLWPTLAD